MRSEVSVQRSLITPARVVLIDHVLPVKPHDEVRMCFHHSGATFIPSLDHLPEEPGLPSLANDAHERRQAPGLDVASNPLEDRSVILTGATANSVRMGMPLSDVLNHASGPRLRVPHLFAQSFAPPNIVNWVFDTVRW